MRIAIAVLIILGAVFLSLFIRVRIKKAAAGSLIFKSLTSVCFILTSLCALRISLTFGDAAGYGLFTTAGLLFGLLGDVWLDLRYNCRSESVTYTFAGFIAFAVGHIFFLIALIRYCMNGAGAGFVLIPFILAAVLGVGIVAAGPVLHLDYGVFKKITVIYAALLISSALVSGSLLIHSAFGSVRLRFFFIGSVLFLLSDLILSGTYFGQGKDRPVDIISNHVFYYGAQFLIALSAAFAG